MLISLLQKIPVLIVGILLIVGALTIYFRSKNVTKAEKHKNSFDHSLIDNISTYWLHWSDSTCPFEDISEYRFWGLPYKNLEKIAKTLDFWRKRAYH